MKSIPSQFRSFSTPPYGICIYCRRTEPTVKLSKEHAIPFALNGPLILAKASCSECADVTKRFEGHVLGGLFLEARTHLGYRTRHKKNRPMSFRKLLTDGEVDLPIATNPLVLRLPNLVEPPILTGKAGNDWIECHAPVFLTFVGASNTEQRENAEKFIASSVNFTPTDFCLFLAKIAHCLAVYFLGLDGFRPLLADYIRNANHAVCDYVGICDQSPPDFGGSNADSQYRIHTGGDWIVVYMRFFARFETPYYQVVVGKPLAG